MTNDCFHVMGNADQYGRLSHVADFTAAVEAVAFARTIKGGKVLPGAKIGNSIHYTAVNRMSREIKAAWRN